MIVFLHLHRLYDYQIVDQLYIFLFFRYIDPDGMKREYNYETGILCDPNKRDLEEQEESEDPERGALQDNGAYIDYQENQMVLPSGQRINLSNIGKNKTKRPIFRNN